MPAIFETTLADTSGPREHKAHLLMTQALVGSTGSSWISRKRKANASVVMPFTPAKSSKRCRLVAAADEDRAREDDDIAAESPPPPPPGPPGA